MYRISTLNKIAAIGLEELPRDRYEIASELANPDAILVRSAELKSMELPESLKAIARAGAGTNNIAVDRCTERGIVVFNTPGANANGVKELVIAAMLLSSRKILDGAMWARSLAGKRDEVPKLVEAGKSQFAGPELLGKKLGVVGLGAIGVMVANAAISLGMEVYGYDPFISVESAWGLSREVKRSLSLEGLLAECDYVTLHVPMNDRTRGMMNRHRIAAMKPGARLLNFARGGLVVNEDLVAALRNGTLSCYATDFPEEELLGEPNVLPIPHLGASTPESEDNCAVMACRQLREFLEAGTIRNSVNFPECRMDQTGKFRLLVANRNVPNMISQIATTLAAEGINIADMLNRHQGEVAYNIIDTESAIDPAVIERIRAIDGIIMVRTIPNGNRWTDAESTRQSAAGVR